LLPKSPALFFVESVQRNNCTSCLHITRAQQLILALKDFTAHNLCSNSPKMTSFSAVSELCAQASPTECFQHLTDIIKKIKVFFVRLCPLTVKKKLFQSLAFLKSVKPHP